MNPVSDVYVFIMERLMPIIKANGELFIIIVGGLFLLGAIFRWQWVCDPQGDNTLGFNAFIYRSFGEFGYRILMGLSGIIIICFGIMLLMR